jgi:hypothetical protein
LVSNSIIVTSVSGLTNEIVLHPYYKLAYIKLAWGGPDEQEKERAAGNQQAKNWQDEAKKVMETKVVFNSYLGFCLANKFQMEEYWKDRPRTAESTPATSAAASASVLSDYDRYRRTLVAEDDDFGWESELRRYLKDLPPDVTAETNIIEWWQVCLSQTSIIIRHSCYFDQ